MGMWQILNNHEITRDRSNALRVAERSLGNLVAALHETDRSERKVLIVLIPLQEELNGNESDLTKHVRAVLNDSNYDVLDLYQPMSAVPRNGALFYADGNHLELAGHQFVGDRIAEKLESSFAGQP
jgi:lysophospholipase L1-like esterase